MTIFKHRKNNQYLEQRGKHTLRSSKQSKLMFCFTDELKDGVKMFKLEFPLRRIYITFALPDLLGNGVTYILDIKIYFPRYVFSHLPQFSKCIRLLNLIKIKFLLAKLLKQNLYEVYFYVDLINFYLGSNGQIKNTVIWSLCIKILLQYRTKWVLIKMALTKNDIFWKTEHMVNLQLQHILIICKIHFILFILHFLVILNSNIFKP